MDENESERFRVPPVKEPAANQMHHATVGGGLFSDTRT
jgi:hypothetical protein